MLLDERALRRPEFQDGQEVVMSDGQGWTLPFPVPSGWGRYPWVDQSGKYHQTCIRPVYEGELGDILDDVLFGTADEVESALLRAGVLLLCRNYELTGRQAARLVQFRSDDPTSADRYDGIMSATMGIQTSPKPSSVGEPPASSPTESTPESTPS